MSVLRVAYLILAVAGAVVPVWFLAVWVGANGMDAAALGRALTANAAARGLVWDMVIAAAAVSVWVLAECYVRKDWLSLIVIPVSFLVGVSCGLPLFLFLRTRPVA